ncbi:MAG: hypothetical protein ACLFR1_07830 [Spirochaetia bacterium]
MSMRKYLETAPIYEIEKYKKQKDYYKHCVPYSGTPKQHPYDPEKVVLIISPISHNTEFIEFLVRDIEYAEDLPNLVTEEGESLKMVRIWIKKGSFALKYLPFEVDVEPRYLKDSEILHQYMTSNKNW